jgi:CcmD family protein
MNFLFAAVAVIWLAIFLYLLGIDLKLRALAREIDTLKKTLSGGGQ